jgi:exodeoxyribonuclease-5
MINDELYDFVISLAGQRGTKVLFIGDDAQLKPVKQRSKSKAFRRDKHISKLTKVMRTADGNPMPSEVLQKIRDNQSSKEDMFEHKTMLNSKGDGIIFLNTEEDFFNIVKNEFTLQKFLQNRFSIRAVAYTNDRVRQLNDMIRINMFGFSADKFNEGEMIMMYENIGYNPGDQDYDYPNGSDNVVIDSVPIDNKKITNPVTGKIHEVKGWDLTLVRAKDNKPRSQNLFVADMNVVSAEYLKDLNELKNLALQQGLSKVERGKRWSDYYKFASQYLLMDNVYLYKDNVYVSDKEIRKQFKADNPTLSDSQVNYQVARLKAKDKTLDYSYAHTIHKSQGGTYDKVLVDENNIDIAKRFPSPDYEMINQLKYVAFSRSSKQTIVLSSKSDGIVNSQDVIDLNNGVKFEDLSVSLSEDLGMTSLEFMKGLSKEDRESYSKLLNNNSLKIKCNG